MSRRKTATKRRIKPDSVYNMIEVQKMINLMMWDGKKTKSQQIVYDVLKIVDQEMLLKAIANVRPSVEIRSRRVGGATYQIPTPIRPERAFALSLRFLIKAARDRSEKTMVNRLTAEIKNACEETGAAFKKKVEMQRTAASNQAFAHYSWS